MKFGGRMKVERATYQIEVPDLPLEKFLINQRIKAHPVLNWKQLPCLMPQAGLLTIHTFSFHCQIDSWGVFKYLEERGFRPSKYSWLALLADVAKDLPISPMVSLNSVYQEGNKYYAVVLKKIGGAAHLELEKNGQRWSSKYRFVAESLTANQPV